jgi:hypothetical protein
MVCSTLAFLGAFALLTPAVGPLAGYAVAMALLAASWPGWRGGPGW